MPSPNNSAEWHRRRVRAQGVAAAERSEADRLPPVRIRSRALRSEATGEQERFESYQTRAAERARLVSVRIRSCGFTTQSDRDGIEFYTWFLIGSKGLYSPMTQVSVCL